MANKKNVTEEIKQAEKATAKSKKVAKATEEKTIEKVTEKKEPGAAKTAKTRSAKTAKTAKVTPVHPELVPPMKAPVKETEEVKAVAVKKK